MSETEIVVLKVRLHREFVQRRRGQRLENVYPDFNRLPPEVRTPPWSSSPLDWAVYVDQVGWGWVYDNVSGFGFSDEVNPDRGTIYGCIGVCQEFADAAVAMFPDTCEVMDPDEFVVWRTERGMPNADRVRYDHERLMGLSAAVSLAKEVGDQQRLGELVAEARKALDPSDEAPGVSHNRMADWDTFAAKRGIRLKGRRRGA